MTIKTWAERLEHIPDGAITTNAHVQSAMLEEIEELRTQLADAELHTKQVERGLDKATAQLAEIEKIEPVAYMVQFSPGSRWVELTKEEFDSDLDGHIVYKKQAFFTRPMPAKDAETGMIKLPEPVAWLANYGGNVYTEAQLKQAVRDALDAQGVEDAARYRWLRDYLISPSTHFDDLIVSADKAETLDDVIDAARASLKGAKQ